MSDYRVRNPAHYRRLTAAQTDHTQKRWVAAIENPVAWRNNQIRIVSIATGRAYGDAVEKAWGLL